MPFYNGTLFEIDRKEMLRYAGMNPKGKNFPEEAIQSAIQEALALAEPKGIWQVIPYSPSEGKIEGNPPLVLSGNSIRHHLANSWSTAVLAVTVGDEIEKASDAAFKSGDYVRGLLLDAAATTATEHLADQLDRLIQKMRLGDQAGHDPYISLVKRLAVEEKLDFDTAKLLIDTYKKEKR